MVCNIHNHPYSTSPILSLVIDPKSVRSKEDYSQWCCFIQPPPYHVFIDKISWIHGIGMSIKETCMHMYIHGHFRRKGVEVLIVTFESVQAIHFIHDCTLCQIHLCWGVIHWLITSVAQGGLRILITLFSPPLLQYQAMHKPIQSPNGETLGSSLLFDIESSENVVLRLTLAAHGMVRIHVLYELFRCIWHVIAAI